ncbi:MAG: hypothetical protein JSV04_13530 [Candidatus Heimdallarchaeota archaeon]|nr:MAG: hypothetical protein JSV04_13530 [Candidatus Heimdallarchaeota archaeon]
MRNSNLSNTGFEVIWFVEENITASTFPLGFFTFGGTNNVKINTSWGPQFDKNISQTNMIDPDIFWIPLPEEPQGTGTVSLHVNDVFYATHPVNWHDLPLPPNPPIQVTMLYSWFNWWIGTTLLNAVFSANGTVLINHTVLRKGAFPNELPINKSFTFQSGISSEEWGQLTAYLQENKSHTWQSWKYSPGHGEFDYGGYQNTLTIYWNKTSQKTVTTLIDNDSGDGDKIYCNPVAEHFQNLLLAKTMDLISLYFESVTTSKISTATPGLISPSLLVNLLVVILWRRKVIKEKTNSGI